MPMKTLITSDEFQAKVKEIETIFGKRIKELEETIRKLKEETSKEKEPGDSGKASETEWNTFFSTNNITSLEDKNHWKNKSDLTPKEAQTACDNGWKSNSKNITGKKIAKYTTDKTEKSEDDVDVLNVNKGQLDKAHEILRDIDKASHHYDLPDDKWEKEINNLTEAKLPTKKKPVNIRKIRDDRIKTFFYSLNDPKDGGWEEKDLEAILSELNKVDAPLAKPEPITSDLLNQLLAIDEEGNWKKGKLTLTKEKDFLTILKGGKRGYDIKKERPDIIAEEDSWGEKGGKYFAPWKKGTRLLRYSYEKNPDKEGIPFNPHNPFFCKWGSRKILVPDPKSKNRKKRIEITVNGAEDDIGHLAIGTGIGKTTKLPNCACNGGKVNIIIVAPSKGLAKEAYNIHSGKWMQNYGCPYHAKLLYDKDNSEIAYQSHGGYETILNDLTYWVDATDKKNIKIEGKKGISVLYWPYFFGYLVRSLCDLNSVSDEAEGKGSIKKKLIPKKDTVIFCDEAHDPQTGYQAVIEQAVKLGYRIIKMSATFPKKNFSITSTYPRSLKSVNGFSDKMKGVNGEYIDWSEGNVLIFVKDVEEFKTEKEHLLKEAGVSYCILDQTLENAAQGISEGMENGLIIAENIFELGFTFHFLKKVIITTWCKVMKLKGDWTYGLEVQNITWASFIQQFGRIGRTVEGDGFTLAESMLGEPPRFKDLTAAIVGAALSGKGSDEMDILDGMNKRLANVNLLRNAISLPEKFGESPEVIMVGIGGTDKKPEFNNFPKSGTPDEDLKKKHSSDWEPKAMDKEQGKSMLRLMIITYLKRQANFPKKVNIDFRNILISGTKIEITEVKKIFNSFIVEKLKEIHKDAKLTYKPKEWKYKDEKLFSDTVNIYKLLEGVVISLDEDKLKINYEVKVSIASYPSTSWGLEEERTDIGWECNICLKMNDENEYCRGCGFRRGMDSFKARIEVPYQK